MDLGEEGSMGRTKPFTWYNFLTDRCQSCHRLVRASLFYGAIIMVHYPFPSD